MTAGEIAAEIVRAELDDNWRLANLLRTLLKAANKKRVADGLKPIRATQEWYFEQYKREG